VKFKPGKQMRDDVLKLTGKIGSPAQPPA
jgi:hypothetical protein